MRKVGRYDNMTASDLARITREKGLEKPKVLTLREWADWLAEDDAKQAAAPARTNRADLEAMTIKELKTEAQRRGIDTGELKRKDEFVDAIEAAQGKSEAQQAAEDGVAYDGDGESDATEADESG